ncbi:unnamed protein product [Aphanomyces euteiches]|uniref:UDENN domain-containing protein n=1 Tax=Aphanomyces euteiches TaxID=100861 RepID=A0A6G0XN70_9STRA|nr:hypothetical protein Ae201684_003356 [Aphanomyces euteiches]KAH9128447.1 hypothetical protein AeMF1_001391 [Aphanomyces euteiches]KAH9163953.1 hypothetical protein LEN26_000245 [Aphanomyces euteiches]KAH9195125.1 hypothetical protein AeNC1_002908 [Aphanomyces euteiches]
MEVVGPSNKWGVVAIASVVFDIDVGQSLEMVYPDVLSPESKQSIAYLSLPHSNKHEEGDTQFSFRFRRHGEAVASSSSPSSSFYYGFVLFRQRKDTTRHRGYFQKSLVIVTELPFVGLYDRVLRIVGPLYFQVGNPLLEALYENVSQWPAPVPDSTMVLAVAGTSVTFVVPKIIRYEDTALYTRRWSLDQESFDVDAGDVADDTEDGVDPDAIVRNGKFCVQADNTILPSPSFADLLNTNELGMSFESVGLFSSFEGLETCLWDLWQLAITGESVMIASPNSRVCSQAVLAFTSLMAPVPYHGDFRPYFTLYESDFKVLVTLHENGHLPTTVLGTTNPFFLKSLSHWPNALIFSFAEAPPSNNGEMKENVEDNHTSSKILKRIKRSVELDSFSDIDEPRLLTRTTRLVVPDRAVLRQLVEASSNDTEEPRKPGDEAPHVSINNALLRKHFKKVTEMFLKPFEEYFGIWSNHLNVPTTPYMDITSFMKPFHAKEFLTSLSTRPHKLPYCLRTSRSKVKTLYARFIASPHFQPWFNYRRNECIKEFDTMLFALRETLTSKELLLESSGNVMDVTACKRLIQQIQKTIEVEQAKPKPDLHHVDIMERHLKDVTTIIESQPEN